MNEHIARRKRFVPVKEYQRISGLSYKTIMHMAKTGQISHIETESGQIRIDTQNPANDGVSAVMDKLNEMQRMVYALCKQLNTVV
ncbi:MAG: hypothetical protein FWB80_01525 [Defluviitaleaceae bacterium]|nr:hypothetical protein [Defluviitaleaceae bacterium]